MKLRQFSVLLAGLAAGSAAFAQPAPSPSNEQPIIVTGRRDGGRLLSVDFQRVARQCAECRRVLAEIGKRSAPYKVKKGQLSRDQEATFDPNNGSIAQHVRGQQDRIGNPVIIPDGAGFLNPFAGAPQQTRAGRLSSQARQSFQKDQVELATIRGDTSKLVAHFLAQLEPHVIKAAEEERVQRKASAVIKLERRATQARAVEVTDAIIRRIDAQQITFTLPPAEGQSAAR